MQSWPKKFQWRRISLCSVENCFVVILVKNVIAFCHCLKEQAKRGKYKIYGSSIKRVPGSRMELNPMF